MNIFQIPNGPIESNCYIIETEKSLIVIDPSIPLYDVPVINKPIEAIIITHCHYDHIATLENFINSSNAPVYCHPLELPSFNDPTKNGSSFFMMDEVYPLPDRKIRDEDYLLFDDSLKLTFMHTPGHTMGSICVLLSKNDEEIAVFTGDTLFKLSAGRTDLGGNPILLEESLKKLAMLNDNVVVYSGHGPKTTIGFEKANNPFM